MTIAPIIIAALNQSKRGRLVAPELALHFASSLFNISFPLKLATYLSAPKYRDVSDGNT